MSKGNQRQASGEDDLWARFCRIRAAIALGGLKLDGIEWRQLEKAGLLNGSREIVGDAAKMERLLSAKGKGRLASPPGPYLFAVKAERACDAIWTPDILISAKPELRSAAIEFLLSAASAGGMSARVQRILQQCRDAGTARSKPSIAKANEAREAIEHDYPTRLSAFRQCSAVRWFAGREHLLQSLLLPDIEDIKAIPLPAVYGGGDQRFIDKCVERAVGARNLVALCNDFVERIGFMPVTGPLALSKLILEWMARRRRVDVGTVRNNLLKWRSQSKSILASYWTLEALACVPGASSDVDLVDTKELIRSFGSSKHRGRGTDEGWALHSALAIHFQLWIELQLPGAKPEIVSSMSLWLAYQIESAIGDINVSKKWFLQHKIEPMNELLSQLHRLVGPPYQRSPLRSIIANLSRPWAAIFLCRIGECDEAFWKRISARSHRKILLTAATSLVVAGVSGVEGKGNGAIQCAADPSSLLLRISGLKSNSPAMHELARVVVADVNTSDPAQMKSALVDLWSMSKGPQVAILQKLTMGIQSGASFDDAITSAAFDVKWRDAFVVASDAQSRIRAAEVLCAVQSLLHNDWDILVPHLFARLVEAASEQEEVERWLFMTIRGAVCGQALSAVRRITVGAKRKEVISAARRAFEVLQNVSRTDNRWMKSKLSGATFLLSEHR